MSPTTHLLNSLTASLRHWSTALASVKWHGGDKHGAPSITQATATPVLSSVPAWEGNGQMGKVNPTTGLEVMLQLASCSYCWTSAYAGTHRDYGKQEATGEFRQALHCSWQARELTCQTWTSSFSISVSHLREALWASSEKGTGSSTASSSQNKARSLQPPHTLL